MKDVKLEKRIRGRDAKEKENDMVSQAKTALIISAPIIAAFLIFFFFILPLFSVPFSTFKNNFRSANRIALLVTYYNSSQYAYESQCFSTLIQAIAYTRNASTIDFYLLNQTNCTFSPNGLGHELNVVTKPSSYCLNSARSEPSISLNYSPTNYTIIRAYKLYVYGNKEYMAKCPIAVDMS